MKNRDYTMKERREALNTLADNGGNITATAKALGIPRTTLSQWRRDIEDPLIDDLQQEEGGGAAEADRLAEWRKIADTGRKKIGERMKDSSDPWWLLQAVGLAEGRVTALESVGAVPREVFDSFMSELEEIGAGLSDTGEREKIAALIEKIGEAIGG